MWDLSRKPPPHSLNIVLIENMGPKSSSSQWAGPLAKFSDRAARMYQERLPHWLALRKYSCWAIAVLLYLGQVCLPSKTSRPLRLHRLEQNVALLQIPCVLIVWLLCRCSVEVSSPVQLLLSLLANSGLVRLKGCEDYVRRVKKIIQDHLPLAIAYSTCEVL